MQRSLGRRRQSVEATYRAHPDAARPIMRRSWIETSCEILAVIRNGGVRPTHIMYRANISWKALKEHMKVLEKHALVLKATRGGRPSYILTSKGNQLLDQFLSVKKELLNE